MEITNRVKNSGLVTIDLEDFLPREDELIGIDIENQLWQGLVLREKDFRHFIEETDWSVYQGKSVFLHCSADAIVPPWAYMLISSSLYNHTTNVCYSDRNSAVQSLVLLKIAQIQESEYQDARVVIKGCAKITNIEQAFTALTMKLRGVVKSIMYGEPCSTVPIYKAPKKNSAL